MHMVWLWWTALPSDMNIKLRMWETSFPFDPDFVLDLGHTDLTYIMHMFWLWWTALPSDNYKNQTKYKGKKFSILFWPMTLTFDKQEIAC